MPYCLRAGMMNAGAAAERMVAPLRAAADLAVGLTPDVSTAQDATVVATGFNPVTGESVGVTGRLIALAGLVTPASGGEIRGAGAAARALVGDFIDNPGGGEG
jgi:hypothetical protein